MPDASELKFEIFQIFAPLKWRNGYDDERSARNESKTNGETINSYFWFTHFSLNWQREFIQHFLLPFRLDILNEFFPLSLTHSLAIHAAVYKYFFRSEWIAFASSFGTNYSLTIIIIFSMTESSLTTEVTISSLRFCCCYFFCVNVTFIISQSCIKIQK